MAVLSETLQARRVLLESVRKMVDAVIVPQAAEVDETDRYPEDWFVQMAELGLFCATFPEQVGGPALDHQSYGLVVEEVARGSVTAGLILVVQELAATPILLGGNPEQHARWLRPLVEGTKRASFGLTEPGAGSDVAGLTTRAERCEGGYRITGQKVFSSGADRSDYVVVFARTAPGTGPRGISAFIVETSSPGFSIGKKEKKMGTRGLSACELILEEVFVPEECRLGEEGEGFSLAMRTLDATRPMVAACGVGVARGALEVSLRYAAERQQFGRPIADFQGLRFMLADMAMQVEGARQMVLRAAREQDEGGKNLSLLGASAKCVATDVGMAVTTNAVQVLGGYGYVQDFPVERMMRDAKLLQIVEGTNQVQRVVVAAELFRLLDGHGTVSLEVI